MRQKSELQRSDKGRLTTIENMINVNRSKRKKAKVPKNYTKGNYNGSMYIVN